MPEIGAQERQPGGDISTGTVGIEQRFDRERVAQVVVVPTSAQP